MQTAETIKNWGPASRIRRNHALEHATLQVLAEHHKASALAGLSDTRGFWVWGEVDSEDLVEAVKEARQRLGQGESQLAIHPNCGTNFVATGLVAGLLGWLSMLGMGKSWQERFDRLPNVVTLITVGLIFSQPLGPFLQKTVTTQADLGELRLVEVRPYLERQPPAHRVLTQG